jgi:hypothetical protein
MQRGLFFATRLLAGTQKGVTSMAGPQFATPKGASPKRPHRRFTVDQANRALPLVRRIVNDIVGTHQQAMDLQGQLESCAAAEQPSIQKKLQGTLEHLSDYIDELTDIGCELKDYRIGLVDFVGCHQGKDVYLCWKLGEDKVEFWHDLHTGFAGRQPIATLQENT